LDSESRGYEAEEAEKILHVRCEHEQQKRAVKCDNNMLSLKQYGWRFVLKFCKATKLIMLQIASSQRCRCCDKGHDKSTQNYHLLRQSRSGIFVLTTSFLDVLLKEPIQPAIRF
jgi:hypothetical protein